MIEVIDLDSTKVVGTRISGKISKPDMERLIDACEQKFTQSEPVSIYVEVESLGGISLEALVADLKFALANFKRFDKKAVVSDQQWLGKMAEFGDQLFPSLEVRHFSLEQKQAALDWILA